MIIEATGIQLNENNQRNSNDNVSAAWPSFFCCIAAKGSNPS